MNEQNRLDLRIRAFLEEGQVDLPDRAFDVVRGEINRTRQRVVIGPWAAPSLAALGRVGLAAALVVAVGVAWSALVLSPGPGGRSPTPTPVSSFDPLSPPIAFQSGPVPPGRYLVNYPFAAGSDGQAGPTVEFDLPYVGWSSFESFWIEKGYGPGDANAGPAFAVWKIEKIYTNPCGNPAYESPAPGPGILALLEALADQPGISAGPIKDVVIDGYPGKVVDLTVTADTSACPEKFHPWNDRFVSGDGEVNRVYAIDVDGFRLTFFARLTTHTTAADRAELESILASIRIKP